MILKTVAIILLALSFAISCNRQTSKFDKITNYSSFTSEMKTDHIPDSIFEMRNLRSLSIIGMECDVIILDDKENNLAECWVIKEIPPQIRNLKNLEYLKLGLNAIRILPEEIGELKNLKILDLSENPELENIENILLIDNLEELYLYGCGLSRLPNNLTKLKKLSKLGLSGNNLSETEKNRINSELNNCEIIYE